MQNPQHGKEGLDAETANQQKDVQALMVLLAQKVLPKREQTKFFSVFLASKDKT